MGLVAYKTLASKPAALHPEGIGKELFASEAQGSLQVARRSTGLSGGPSLSLWRDIWRPLCLLERLTDLPDIWA